MSNRKNSKPGVSRSPNQVPILLIGLLLVVVIIGVVFALSRPTQSSPTAEAYPAEITVEQASEKREQGAFILDVREPDEWQQFHIPDATLIPLGELDSRVNELPKDQEIVVVCRTGRRSAQGRDILRQAGFSQVSSMSGGMMEWQEKGYETASGE